MKPGRSSGASAPLAGSEAKASRGLKPALLGLLVVIGVVRIVSTYKIFSETWDEVAWNGSRTELTRSSPSCIPLSPAWRSRSGRFWLGIRWNPQLGMWAGGNAILAARNQYLHNLALARAGAALLRDLRLLDVVLGCDAIWRNGGGGSGAVFHDVSGDSRARGFGHHRYGRGRRIHGRSARLHYWLESPTNSRSALLGVTTAPGFALQIQRSRFLAQVGSRCVVWQGLLERGEHSVAPSFRWGRGLVVTPAAATLVLWAGFRFTFGSPLRVRRTAQSKD